MTEVENLVCFIIFIEKHTSTYGMGDSSVALFVADRLLCVTHYVHIQHTRLLPPALLFFLISLGDKYE